MANITNYYKFEKKLRYFEGWITGVETTRKDDGSFFSKFSIPLKLKKEDEPLWLNCKIFGAALCKRFSSDCNKGSRIGIWGEFNETKSTDGKEYINFVVKDYVLFERALKKAEG